MREQLKPEGGKVQVSPFDGQVLRKVYVCYDCMDQQWRKLDTGWMSKLVAVFRRLRGHDVRGMRIIPDEGVIVSPEKSSLDEAFSFLD